MKGRLWGFAMGLAVAGALALAGGCCCAKEEYPLEYKPAPPVDLGGTPKGKALFVKQLVDVRGLDERRPFQPDDSPLLLVPLWPYTTDALSPIIRFSYLQLSLKQAMNELVLTDLKAAGLFESVAGGPEAKAPAEGLVLDLTLKRAVWERHATAYGLSYPGMVLWGFGLPTSYGSVSLEVEAALRDAKTGRVLAHETIAKRVPCTEWMVDQINYLPPKSEFRFIELFPQFAADLRDMLKKALKDGGKQ